MAAGSTRSSTKPERTFQSVRLRWCWAMEHLIDERSPITFRKREFDLL